MTDAVPLRDVDVVGDRLHDAEGEMVAVVLELSEVLDVAVGEVEPEADGLNEVDDDDDSVSDVLVVDEMVTDKEKVGESVRVRVADSVKVLERDTE
jgi:hypothetical protein